MDFIQRADLDHAAQLIRDARILDVGWRIRCTWLRHAGNYCLEVATAIQEAEAAKEEE